MHEIVSTELYIDATSEEAARAVATGGDEDLTLDGSWHREAWGPSVDVWRQDATWRRGATTGAATIDLVAADAGRTLLIVTLRTARRWTLHRPRVEDAARIARRLRASAECGRTAVAVPLEDAAAARPRTERPVPAVVGYSGP